MSVINTQVDQGSTISSENAKLENHVYNHVHNNIDQAALILLQNMAEKHGKLIEKNESLNRKALVIALYSLYNKCDYLPITLGRTL